ncbi:MAG: hypothetical protein OXG19_02725 [Chloroflexi bacterium]|nr:hypothetical protein [Chloroflexota bacterium]
MRRAKIATALLVALLAVLASTAALAANTGGASDGDGDPAIIDADCLAWRVAYTNAAVGRDGSVDFELYEAALAFRDSLCDQTSYPIFENVRGPDCLGADVHVRITHDNPGQVRADGRPVAPVWSVRIAPWDPDRFGGAGGSVFNFWQGFQGRDAEHFARALAGRVAENLRSQGFTVAHFAYEAGLPQG